MRKLLLASAALLIGIGLGSAQQQAPGESGYGTPHSLQNAAKPEANAPSPEPETTGQAPKFEDRWPAQAGKQDRPPAATMPDATTGPAPEPSKKMHPEESRSGMDE
jgi:hypothetical protein